MCGRVPNMSLHIVAFRLKCFLFVGTFNHYDTVELAKKRTSSTQNRKLENLGKGSFTSNLDSSCNLRCNSNQKLTEAKT